MHLFSKQEKYCQIIHNQIGCALHRLADASSVPINVRDGDYRKEKVAVSVFGEMNWCEMSLKKLTPAEKCFIIYAQSIYFCVQWGVLRDIFLSTLSLSLLALVLVSGASLTVAECNAKIQIWQFQIILLWLLFCVSVFHPLSPLSLNLLRETQWCHLNTEKLQLLR